MFEKQVEKCHYEFGRYFHKKRWISVWHQISEVLEKSPSCVLDVGPGAGVLAALLKLQNIKVETADIDPDLNPSILLSSAKIPVDDNRYDCVCAFQVLEHLPYDEALSLFREMVRVSKSQIVISLPDAKKVYRVLLDFPFIDNFSVFIPRPRFGQRKNKFDGEHYWEVNREGFSLGKVVSDLSANAELLKTYRVPENPHHRFFIFHKW
ncbi:class I SAM-dependent methyltransferase [Teredinibacter haidensis]|uniref:class I SAM-dependent methyltransferase n=1 Tax=Teredinibacter haidensis TaxID=2731755 RepID=UPI000948E24C|nr:class I SAM-dependent methyltransferase [Teredinibacter haidensis]